MGGISLINHFRKAGAPAKAEERPGDDNLHFHTFFDEEFNGHSARDIIDQLYESSRSGMGNISFEDWWDYQSSLWKSRYRLKTPDPDSQGACEKMLENMVKVGALLEGRLPRDENRNNLKAEHG